MDFTDYTQSSDISLGTVSSAYSYAIVELSDGDYAVMDINSSKIRIRKITKDTTTVLATTYMKDTNLTSNLTADTATTYHRYFSYDLKKQNGEDKFIALGLKNSGNVYINVFNNDLTIDRSINVDLTYYQYGHIAVDSSGNFVYFGSKNAWGDPKIFYYTKDATTASWSREVDSGDPGNANEWFCKVQFLSNDNIIVGNVQRVSYLGGDGQFYFTILDKTDGSTIAGPTVDPVGLDVSVTGCEIVPYTDNFALLWVASGRTKRFGARYTNAGVLQTQTDVLQTGDNPYLIESHSKNIDKSMSTTITTASGEALVKTYIDTAGTYTILVTIHDPNNLNGNGVMSETQEVINYVSNLSHVAPLSGDGGFIVYWVTGTTLYYRSYRSNTPIVMGGAGGDPYIIPVLTRKIIKLPSNRACYNYFDNRDKNRRIVINAMNWMPIFTAKKNSNSRDRRERLKDIFEKYIKGNETYIRYLYIYKEGEEILIDMEKLKLLNCSSQNLMNNLFMHKCQINKKYSDKFKITDIKWKRDIESHSYFKYNGKNVIYREIRFDGFDLVLNRVLDNNLFRNSIDLKGHHKNIFDNCSGLLVDGKLNSLSDIKQLPL